ncbi:hypothetical protein HK097_002489 [Rhizophlyctis rosea]|uniref:Sugar phosphate phosphatase n=1 Tax=Rhizophlyctis rosea TaxID=64517 RepID=A0AAD5SFH2_9FUNG|nr:hypothetical protein HK097_002489 [Rhizophlyctis rosea]
MAQDKQHPLPDGILPLRGSVTTSFAYTTIKDRMPVILTKAIDTLTRHLHDLHLDEGPAAQSAKTAEAKECISTLSKLKYEMIRDRRVTYVVDNESDAETWNFLVDGLKESWGGDTWFSAPWLFVECLMYRKIQEVFNKTENWKNFDVFAPQQKEPAFNGSVKSMIELSKHLANVESKMLEREGRSLALREFIQFSLWGNQTDLSLLINVNHADMHKSQASSAQNLSEFEKNIIVNDMDAVLEKLLNIDGGRIDIVLDNAGFELVADLCLADFLISSGIAKTVMLHAKKFPWFVSDTTPRDLEWTFAAVEKKAVEVGDEGLKARAARWTGLVKEGKWIVKVDDFWTTPYSFWNLPTAAPELRSSLNESSFVIYKGDLNYRKLVYDAEWSTTTPFATAIGPVAETIKAPFVALRTCKSDVAVGLKEGQEGDLKGRDSDWMVSGKYGMVQSFGC